MQVPDQDFSCKAQFGPRGIQLSDKRCDLQVRRAKELAKVTRRLRLEDQRSWAALRCQYSLAEQAATRGFQNTVIFEPFGGKFGVTRVASSEWGWTNSQPLDRLDGHDLLAQEGQALLWKTLAIHQPFLVLIAFDCRIWSLLTNMSPSVNWELLRKTVGKKTLKLVKDICKYQHDHNRYFLLENPLPSAAWTYHDILKSLLTDCGGKFVIGDQCPYGQRDPVSGLPEQKRTGWLGNSEVILNEVGRRCSCPHGSHQHIVGSNQFGQRSKQAASYPTALCRAICRGVLKEMQLIYVINELRGEHAMPVEDEEDAEMEEVSRPDEGPNPGVDEDSWELDEVNLELTRHHRVPRRHLFVPLLGSETPVPLDRLTGQRTVHCKTVNEDRTWTFTDNWTDRVDGGRELDRFWVGRTVFALHPLELALPEESAPQEVEKKGALRRRRVRTRQLQRGLWSIDQNQMVKTLMELAHEMYQESGASGNWIILDLTTEVGKEWKALESAQVDLRLILSSVDARRLRKPQPHAQAAEVPLRKTLLLMSSGDILPTGWEDWQQTAPGSQMRPLPRQPRRLCITLFGAQIGADEVEDGDGEPTDPLRHREEERLRKWNALPRELKLAIQRIHTNLGHARLPDMLRALRISKASEVALKACRLFRCSSCPRLLEPKIPRPSRLPQVDEFNVVVGLDVFSEKDASGGEWTWLNVVDEGTGFQVCTLLGETFRNPTSQEVLQAFEVGWRNWAGMPERGLVLDRAKYFLGTLAARMSEEGCVVDFASKASPWQIAYVERAGGTWKTTFRRLVWAEQVSGREDVLVATGAINAARNNLARRSGFSPAQWVLGRSVRLPADLTDEAEISRIGAQSMAATPTTKFFRKTQLRMSAREAFVRTANDAALRRAELRRVRPTRGPFRVGDYVFYYDEADNTPGPNHWRGVARVIGHEGSRTVWISHRGILVAASPEHLAHANEDEIRGWMVTANETSLLDAMPAAGGTGFLDLRSRPTPPLEGFPEAIEDAEQADLPEVPRDEEQQQEQDGNPPLGDVQQPPASEDDLSASSTSAARLQLESGREQRKERRKFDFFEQQQRRRQQDRESKKARLETIPDVTLREAFEVPVGPDFDPELDDFHQAVPAETPPPIMEADDVDEAQERAAKRLRLGESSTPSDANSSFCFLALVEDDFLEEQSKACYQARANTFEALGVDEETFLFGAQRNDFYDQYMQLLESSLSSQSQDDAPPLVKKKARKELYLKDLDRETRVLFDGPEGSDAKEWRAWLEKGAVEVLPLEESRKVLRDKQHCLIPTRWVRTNKSDGKPDEPFFPKSRLVVQGFKDRSLGQFRRDAPTGSALAEAIVLSLSAAFGFKMVCKDIKNAYFSGKEIGRELYLLPPKGGLPGVLPGQVMRARKAIYGFAEAARLFWLALREHLQSDGWCESRLEPALFYLRDSSLKLRGILVTHVDDIQAGVDAAYLESAFQKSSLALEFATNHFDSYTFRGREIKQVAGGHIDVTMSNYVRSMRPVKIDRERRKHLEARLTAEEKETMQSSCGELGWVARQLRSDLAFENGCLQRSKSDPCVADLVRLRMAVSSARRAADFRQRFWSDVDPYKAVVVHLADSVSR